MSQRVISSAVSLTTAVQTLFTASADGGRCGTFKLFNTGAQIALVCVQPIHRDGEYFPVAASASEEFTDKDGGIVKVSAKSAASTTTVRGGVKGK